MTAKAAVDGDAGAADSTAVLVPTVSRHVRCVSDGAREDGKYSLFATETWQLLKKNTSEFEELAAMQAGFGFRPVTARRDGRCLAQRSAAHLQRVDTSPDGEGNEISSTDRS